MAQKHSPCLISFLFYTTLLLMIIPGLLTTQTIEQIEKELNNCKENFNFSTTEVLCDPQNHLSTEEYEKILGQVTAFPMTLCPCVGASGCLNNSAQIFILIVSNDNKKLRLSRENAFIRKIFDYWSRNATYSKCPNQIHIIFDYNKHKIFTQMEGTYRNKIDDLCIEEVKRVIYRANSDKDAAQLLISTIFEYRKVLEYSSHACQDNLIPAVEVMIGVILAVLIFLMFSCFLILKFCRTMESPLIIRARIMQFNPAKEKQLLAKVCDSLKSFPDSPANTNPELELFRFVSKNLQQEASFQISEEEAMALQTGENIPLDIEQSKSRTRKKLVRLESHTKTPPSTPELHKKNVIPQLHRANSPEST